MHVLESGLSRGLIISSLLVVMVGITVSMAENIDWKWEEWKPATCMPDHCFCERVQPGVAIRQPANAWSNYGFILVGLISMLDSLTKLPRNNTGIPIMASSRFYRFLFGFSVVLVGFGSLMYHASMTFVGQWVDVMGMYFIVVFSILYNAILLLSKPNGFLSKNSPYIFSFFFLLLNSILGWMLIVLPEYRRHVFFTVVVMIIAATSFRVKLGAFHGLCPPTTKYFLLSLGSILVAIVIWNLDLYRIICEPDSLIQGHAIWHCLCALSAFYLYKFYCSEIPTKSK